MAAAAGGLRKLWLAEPHNKYGGWRLMAAAPMSICPADSIQSYNNICSHDLPRDSPRSSNSEQNIYDLLLENISTGFPSHGQPLNCQLGPCTKTATTRSLHKNY